MRVVVFGGSGFVGSHVADALTRSGHQVTIYDREVSKYIQPSQTMIVGDILDEKRVADVIRTADIVYNFAAISDIHQASQRPLESIKSNILGNTVILQGCIQANIKRFIFASSLYVYGKSGSFYRSSKQACELIIENYHEIFGLPYTILRYGSLYGPRSNQENFIRKIIEQALKQGKITREGDGEEIREYIHIYDAARSSVDILSDEFANQYVIISGNQQMKVKDLLVMIREMLDNKVEIEYVAPSVNYHYEITPYVFTPKLARRIVGRSYLDLGQGLLKSIQSLHHRLNPLPTYEGLVVSEGEKADS